MTPRPVRTTPSCSLKEPGTSKAAVIDANVLIQAPIRDTLLRLAIDGSLYRVSWSNEIIAEVRRTLEGRFQITRARTEHLESELRRHFPEAWVTGFEPLIGKMKNDESDRHVLAAAVHAKACTIVTYNLRDFPLAATEPWNVIAVGPSTFLKELYGSEPALVMETIQQQANDLRRNSRNNGRCSIRLCQHSSNSFAPTLESVSASTATSVSSRSSGSDQLAGPRLCRWEGYRRGR
jgi:predicted nucleic acid-binding protein